MESERKVGLDELVSRLRRGKKAREQFVESHLVKGIAHQLRALRDGQHLSQDELAANTGMTQTAISRLETGQNKGPTVTTLKRLAAEFDVGLVVRFVPFSEMVHWVDGLSTDALEVQSFEREDGKS